MIHFRVSYRELCRLVEVIFWSNLPIMMHNIGTLKIHDLIQMTTLCPNVQTHQCCLFYYQVCTTRNCVHFSNLPNASTGDQKSQVIHPSLTNREHFYIPICAGAVICTYVCLHVLKVTLTTRGRRTLPVAVKTAKCWFNNRFYTLLPVSKIFEEIIIFKFRIPV